LEKFSNAFFRCNTVVAHNILFDKTLIRVEVERNKKIIKDRIPFIDSMFHPAFDTLLGINHFDTMVRTVKICQIYLKTSQGNIKLKPPKLLELYQILFHETPIHMHNSMVDTLVCMRCFLKINYKRDIDDDAFENMLKQYGSEVINKFQRPKFSLKLP
jgi:DNA polymerase III epsilon subunit-like protein